MFHADFRQKGFTLVELITVIVILGILVTVGSSKFFSNSPFEETRDHQEVLSALRFAQKIAIASQCPVTVSLTANSFSLNYSDSCSGAVKRPDYQSNYIQPDDFSSVIASSSPSFIYDSSGDITPSSGGTVNVGSRAIVLEAVTGFVHD